MKIIFVVALFIIFWFLCDGLTYVVFGCGRKFKNGRKCKVWSCPNKDSCSFYLENKGNK